MLRRTEGRTVDRWTNGQHATAAATTATEETQVSGSSFNSESSRVDRRRFLRLPRPLCLCSLAVDAEQMELAAESWKKGAESGKRAEQRVGSWSAPLPFASCVPPRCLSNGVLQITGNNSHNNSNSNSSSFIFTFYLLHRDRGVPFPCPCLSPNSC
ncbi:hypothetical protein ACLKA6_003521 [Drosophila palustris]